MSKTRVLFVDDEPNIVEGLRRMLRKQRDEWDIEFALSGAEALAKMAQAPADVIITDMAMPGMSGAELLEKIVRHYPNTARIVLSGHAAESCTTKAAELAHQYLSKPVDADSLKEAVAHTCSMQQLVCNERVRTMVAGCQTLPSLPELYVEISRAVESENASSHEVARIISRDMAMSAKLLQLVNSSFFGIGRRVSNIEQTATLLGFLRIKALVLTEHVFRTFQPQKAIPGFSIWGLWQHSLAVAELAHHISTSEKQSGDRPDQAFTAGLLHDIGILVLASQDADGFRRLLDEARSEVDNVMQVERDLLGVTHAEIGAYLLGLWGLPPRIVEAVALHHTPEDVIYNGLCAVTAVHAADALVSQVGPREYDLYGYPGTTQVNEAYLKRIGLSDRFQRWTALARQHGHQEVEVLP